MRRMILLVVLALAAPHSLAADYTFTVENNSDQRIVKIDVSEDGKNWAPFDIGKGIRSGDSELLAWDESTNNSDCNWLFRATFEGGDVLDSDWLDFCEDDLVITFEFE
jgi:hypothetical protein